MDIKDYAQMMAYLTRPRDVVPEPRPMAQGGVIGKPGGVVEPGVMYYGKLTLDRQNAGPKLKSYVSQYNKLVQKDFEVELDDNLRLKIDTTIVPDGIEKNNSKQAF